MNARLIDAATGYQLWSHAYYESLDDIFRIPAEIANGIAAALTDQPASEARPKAEELGAEASGLYLRARFHRNQWTLESFEKSVDYFERALRLSPNSPQILAGLAEAETNLTILSGRAGNSRSVERARHYARQALAMDPRCSQAHLSLGWISQLYDWQWDLAEREFDSALALNPSFAEAWHLKGISSAVRRYVGDAEESFRRALQLDPLSPVRIPVKWGTDSGEAGQGRSEATLVPSMIGEVPHMSQDSSEIGVNQHHFVSSFGLHRNVVFR